MAIISAGVIMNVFLAFGCFAFYYANPRLEQPPVLGVGDGGLAGLSGRLSAGRRDRGDRRPRATWAMPTCSKRSS